VKTSLNLDDALFELAKAQAASQNKTISEVVSVWAKKGQLLDDEAKRGRKQFRPVDMGGPSKVNILKR